MASTGTTVEEIKLVKLCWDAIGSEFGDGTVDRIKGFVDKCMSDDLDG